MSNSKVRVIGADDAAEVRNAFGQFPSGVAVLAVHTNGQRHALVASSFMVGVSLSPCLVAVAVQKTSESWAKIEAASFVGVSVFGRGQGPLTRQLSSKNRESRFDSVATELSDNGALFVEDAALWLECSVHSAVEAGDHWMILLEVSKIGAGQNEPLVWHGSRFRELIDT